MTIKEAKELDMVDYLARLGHHPTKIHEPNYWFSSPLHVERTPSFKVNRKMNRWKDWGSGEGGNLVDFGIIYHNCSISEFLKKLDKSGETIAQRRDINPMDHGNNEKKNEIKLLNVTSVKSLPLIQYLRERRIEAFIADRYLKEVIYELHGKKYFALGFKNDAGGYELRNQYIKAASSPKDSTFINNLAKAVGVFEGFFNFLSYLTICHKHEIPKRNYLILNSTSFFEKNLPRMQEHEQVHLYLDNDKTGQKFTSLALTVDKQKFKDERSLYKNYDDLNHWLTEIGLSQKQRQQQRP